LPWIDRERFEANEVACFYGGTAKEAPLCCVCRSIPLSLPAARDVGKCNEGGRRHLDAGQLELGGKSTGIASQMMRTLFAGAYRIAWGKLINSGRLRDSGYAVVPETDAYILCRFEVGSRGLYPTLRDPIPNPPAMISAHHASACSRSQTDARSKGVEVSRSIRRGDFVRRPLARLRRRWYQPGDDSRVMRRKSSVRSFPSEPTAGSRSVEYSMTTRTAGASILRRQEAKTTVLAVDN